MVRKHAIAGDDVPRLVHVAGGAVIEIAALHRPAEHGTQIPKNVVRLAGASPPKKGIGDPRDVAPMQVGKPHIADHGQDVLSQPPFDLAGATQLALDFAAAASLSCAHVQREIRLDEMSDRRGAAGARRERRAWVLAVLDQLGRFDGASTRGSERRLRVMAEPNARACAGRRRGVKEAPAFRATRHAQD